MTTCAHCWHLYSGELKSAIQQLVEHCMTMSCCECGDKADVSMDQMFDMVAYSNEAHSQYRKEKQ